MDLEDHMQEFESKSINKGHEPKFFLEKFKAKENTYNRDWNRSLKPQIQDLPDFKDVIRALKKHFRRLND